MLGQEITRKDVARVARTSVQNIGMVITNSMGRDQKLRTESHVAVAEFLKVNSLWLLNGQGPMESIHADTPVSAPASMSTELSPAALELAALFDLIPQAERVKRAQAFNAASTAIMQAL